jgi:hypothetical protein
VPGRELKVAFLAGDRTVQDRVMRTAATWEESANIRFTRVEDRETALLRIAFMPNWAWSYVGTDALLVPPAEPTMSLGPLSGDAPEHLYSRYVLHKFGHALGLLHEHQSAASGVPWDVDAVYSRVRPKDAFTLSDVEDVPLEHPVLRAHAAGHGRLR